MAKAKLRLTNGGSYNSQGLALLRLALLVDDQEKDHTTTVSGQPGRQNFRLGADSQPGSMEPIPEGRYKIGKPLWAGKPRDTRASWGPGLGAVVVDIFNGPGNKTRRAELLIHQDANEEEGAYGTAGCIGTQGETGQDDYGRMNLVCDWIEKYDITELEVDWGLGTFGKPSPAPPPPPPPKYVTIKADGRPDFGRMRRDGEDVAGDLVLKFSHGGGWSAALDGKPVKPASLQLVMKLNK